MSKILEIMNRPSQKKAQEQQQETAEKKRGTWLVRNIKWIMFAFFNAVALVFDGLAVTTVYSLTKGNLLLSALALLPTGIPMFMWEGGWLYPLADGKQKKKAIYGVILSIASALIVGVLAIVADLGDTEMRFWVSVALLVWCVLAVVVHGIWAALYFYKDPIIMRDHELQVTIADNQYQSDSLRESEALLKDAEKMLETELRLKNRFGENEVNRALELLLGVDLNGDGKIGDRKTQNQPKLAYSKDGEKMPELTKNTGENERGADKQENIRPNQNGR
jgi:hypothetical protein